MCNFHIQGYLIECRFRVNIKHFHMKIIKYERQPKSNMFMNVSLCVFGIFPATLQPSLQLDMNMEITLICNLTE